MPRPSPRARPQRRQPLLGGLQQLRRVLAVAAHATASLLGLRGVTLSEVGRDQHWSVVLADAYADYLLGLVVDVDRWVHRRVESLDVHDESSVRRRVSSDLDVNDSAGGPEYVGAVLDGALPYLVVPLGLFAKRDFVDFDLTAADGTALTLLSRRESTPLVSALVRAAVRRAGGGSLPDDVLDLVLEVAQGDEDEGLAAVQRLRQVRDEHPEAAEVLDHPLVAYLVQALSTRFLGLVVLPGPASGRRVLKYGYRSPLHVDASGWRVRLGLEPFRLRTDLPLVGLSASYHLDLVAPASLAVADVVLGRRSGPGERWQDGQVVKEARRSVHLHVEERPDTPDEHNLQLSLVPTRRGLLGRALVVATASSVLLAAVLLWDVFGRSGGADRGNAASLLLLAPAALGAVLSRPREHPLAASVYLLVRVAAQTGTGAALLAAALVGLAGPSGWVTLVLAFLTLVAVVGLVRVWTLFARSESELGSA